MSTTSRLPATIDALYGGISAAIGATKNVVDGPPLQWSDMGLVQDRVTENSFLFIGARPDDDGGDGSQDFNAAGAVSRDETVTVWCTAYEWGGEERDLKGVRDAAFATIGALEQLIRNDATLGQAVMWARVDKFSNYIPRQSPKGCDVLVIFSVTARAYLD